MSNKEVHIDIDPVPKPRMTRADAWKKRPVVLSYWAFKDSITFKAKKQGLVLGCELDLVFIVAMPVSWSKKEKDLMNGKPHQNKPDLDNFIKAVQDCLLKNDSGIYKIKAEKCWGNTGKIIFNQ